MTFTQVGQQNEKRILKSEDTLRDLWDNIKKINIDICIIGNPEGEEREKGPKNLFEEMVAETLP